MWPPQLKNNPRLCLFAIVCPEATVANFSNDSLTLAPNRYNIYRPSEKATIEPDKRGPRGQSVAQPIPLRRRFFIGARWSRWGSHMGRV